MRYFSETTQREYDDMDMVFFRNIKQCIAYISLGATVYDVFVDGSGKLVFCFSKEDHNKFKSIWGTKENNNMGENDG
jgi:hypothetical protein